MYSILFVCTGNICRSPTAEAVFRHYVREQNLDGHFMADSAGTYGYHVGAAPDERSIQVAQAQGVTMEGQQARKVNKADFNKFDLILALDQGHYAELEDIAPASGKGAELSLLLDYHDAYKGQDVPDPYYGGAKDFEQTYKLIAEGVDGLLSFLIKELGLKSP